ncbi:aminoacyl-tRNA hydrolase [Verrucomicrobium spinosum]|uniref:aminoacyl-tRNA hydrolase n=1 Tax=Verrucomicrobium spinosum TaxID=2736 RepID=UPI0009D6C12E|nr:aminoacyl-tRNA hydrolase [Verrucomicrobium spinosum]
MSGGGQKLLIRPRLIVGLGNPGREYADTRHNIGFMVVDALAGQFSASWGHEKRWDCALAKFSGGWLLKPFTYMNASGEAVSSVCRFYKIQPEEVLAVYDDVDLSLGSMRFRMNGRPAGHNGVRSLISHLGTEEFPRLKVGIAGEQGRPAGDRMVGHVLGRFSEAEQPLVQTAVSRAVEAVRSALNTGLENAMNLYNRKESTTNQTTPKP